MPFRAGILSPSHLAGGLEVRLQDEAAVLRGMGGRSWWLAPPFTGKQLLEPGFAQHDCELVDFALADPFRNWRWRHLLMARLHWQARRLRSWNFDFAHVAMSWTSSGLAQALACSDAGVPFVVAVHNFFPTSHLIPWTRASATRAFAGARSIYAVSGTALSAFIDIYERCLPAGIHLDVVENGIDLQRFSAELVRDQSVRNELNIGSDELMLVFAGRLDDKKRPYLAVEVLAALQGLGVPAQLVLLGDGPLRDRVAGLAASLGLTGSVHLVGHCAEPEHYYRGADAFFLPSRSEGMPLALLEGGACGAVPLGYPVPGVLDVISSGVTGLLLNDTSSLQSAQTIAQHWREPRAWQALARHAHETARARFSREVMRDRLAGLYARIFPEFAGRGGMSRPEGSA